MSDKPVDPEESLHELEQDLSDADHDEDTRASIVFALMQFNLTSTETLLENRNDFIEVIKNSDFITRQAGTAIIEQDNAGDRLYFILEGSAIDSSCSGMPLLYEKGSLVGTMSPLANDPCSTSFIAGDTGVSVLVIKRETLISSPAVYRSLLGKGLVIKGGNCDYELAEKLGEGLNGPVYGIQDHKLCAKLYRGRNEGASALPAVIPECVLQQRHPYIVSIHETINAYGSQFIIMDLASGVTIKRSNGASVRCRTLRQMMDVFHSEQQRVSLDMTAKMFRHVATALLYIHDQGYVHRDVKPEHIFIDVRENDITFMLSDFSLAFPISTRPGKIVGSPHYCPPEAIDIDKPETIISGSADFYSLAAVCYELLTDQTVFDSRNVLELAKQHLDAKPDMLRLPADTPIWLGRFIEQALQKDPALRPLRLDIEKLIAVA